MSSSASLMAVCVLARMAVCVLASVAAKAGENTPVPGLEWVKQVGNSGQITAVASAGDRQGNLYIAGNTSSLDFPVVSATQPRPGGSPLTRIDSALGGREVLLDPLLTNATTFAADGHAAFVNNIALSGAAPVRLDAVVNSASQYAVPLSAGESIDAIGSGFDASAQVVLNGSPMTIQARSPGRLTAIIPGDFQSTSAAEVAVVASGVKSNAVVVPTASASPGIYSVSGSGFGEGYILNSDGSLNSPDNPAAVGSAITIFATGVGPVKLDGPYAVTDQPVSVYIDGFYANGISASLRDAEGLPGSIYAISVYIPDPATFVDRNPDLANFKIPPQVPVLMVVGPVLSANPAFSASHSQLGLALSVKPR